MHKAKVHPIWNSWLHFWFGEGIDKDFKCLTLNKTKAEDRTFDWIFSLASLSFPAYTLAIGGCVVVVFHFIFMLEACQNKVSIPYVFSFGLYVYGNHCSLATDYLVDVL